MSFATGRGGKVQRAFDKVNNMDWDDPGPMPNNLFPPPRHKFSDFRNERYSNAYGEYRGGYSPGGGYGPPRFPGPHPGFSQGPPFMWGRGFGPAGPPIRKFLDDRAMKYLLRCGVPRENLKNLPRELLHMCEPEFCGLCALRFDSFTSSRMHYISKNHLKNQKKWLSQQMDSGFYGGSAKEIPFKSRELYCELCDVHITSKTHAESHYAGKPHRSIVEGRKNPKNPFLMKKGMEDRLEQLLRRERKHMKAIEECEEAEEALKESKPILPELYCEICKTSVTCTEQMTMHLNGKKHLAKEKHHILKMMKGEIKNDTVKNEEADAAPEGEQEEVADNENDRFDWGNGSENWDEPTTK